MAEHLKSKSAVVTGTNMGPDDRYWIGNRDEAAFDKALDDAYGPEQ